MKYPLRLTPALCAVAVLAVLAALLGAAASPEESAAKPRQQPRTPPSPLFWGAQIGPQLSGEAAPWDMQAVHRFQHRTRKPLSLISFSAPFAECTSGPCSFYSFPTTPLNNVRDYGAVPMFNWSSEGGPGRQNERAFRLARILDGTFDPYIRGFAESARKWQHPFFLRFNWEMNGFWFPWSEGQNGNKRGEFAAAWRRVHDIFSSVGATNVSWVWCPNVDFTGKLTPLHGLYPGDDYVDWTCLDGFNWGETPNSVGWQTFKQIFGSTYRRVVKIAPRKPMLIGEVASDDRGGSKPAWIRNMLRVVPSRFRKIRGLVWYDEADQGMHWTIDRSPRSARAFANQIQRPVYKANVFGGLTGSPIQPPGWG